MKTANPIEVAVAAYLANIGVEHNCAYVRETKRDAWKCDKWEFSFKTGRADEEFDYFTGLGHRSPMPRINTLMYERMEKMGKPVEPHVTGVLHSLLLDSIASEQSFGSWCSEFGYNEDSRKDLALYEVCQQNADKLNKLFKREQREHLQELLQDY